MDRLRIPFPLLLATAVATLFGTAAAHATPVITTFAEYSTGPITDVAGPQLGGALSSAVTTTAGASRCSITGTCAPGAITQANASASQRETVLGTFSSLVADATFFNGSSSFLSVTSRTTWEESPLVAGPTDISLFIKPGELAIVDYASIVFGSPSSVAFHIELTVNGSVVFFSDADLRGGPTGLVLTENGTDLGGTPFSQVGAPQHVRGYTFDPYFTTLHLGNLTTSDVVRYTMEATVRGQGFETGGYARIGDPFDLTGNGSSIAFTPEPSVVTLLGGGLIALSYRRRS